MTEELDTILHKALGYLDRASQMTYSDDRVTRLHALVRDAADLTFQAIGEEDK